METMYKVTIVRVDSDDDGTSGIAVLPNGETMLTLEPQRYGNQNSNIRKGGSCIPEGQYTVVRRYSPKYKRHTYHITDVPGRKYILIHPGNNEDATLGCILLGLSVGKYKGKKGIMSSAKAVARFEEVMENKPFRLTIKDSLV